MKEQISFEKKENPRVLLGRLTVLRHSKTKYTEKYPDLTDEGMELAQKRAKEITEKHKSSKGEEELFFVSSPRPRAEATLDQVKDSFGEGKETHFSDSIRAFDLNNKELVKEWFVEISNNYQNPENFAKIVKEDERFENRPDVVEPQINVRKRASRAIEFLIRSFDKNLTNKIPHVFAASHFEVISPLVFEIFDLEITKDNILDYVEDVDIDFEYSLDKSKVPMTVSFRGEKRQVVFDRDTREINF